MNYHSKYYDLEAVPKGWRKEEFVLVIKKLESLSFNKLFELTKKFDIKFTTGTQNLDHEDLVSVLVNDVGKSDLLSEVKNIAQMPRDSN